MAAPFAPDKDFPPLRPDAVVVGGGPAGLRAAEVLAAGGLRVALYDQKPSVGRKFLVAGKGGLNLTHSEALEKFVGRYGDELPRWRGLLAGFGPAELRAWAAELGVETYVGTSGRVFPRGQQAAVLLRRWVSRLRTAGVVFHVCHRLENIAAEPATDGRRELTFRETRTDTAVVVRARVIILALGGASWPQTGSDGTWPAMLGTGAPGIRVEPWQAANCGWEVAWDPRVLAVAEGQPLKNIAVTAGGRTVPGEALISRYGLEGGTLYQLGRELRAMLPSPRLAIDFKPDLAIERLRAKLPNPPEGWQEIARRLKLSPAVQALLEFQGAGVDEPLAPHALVTRIKRFPLELRGPRPVEEAISSAGGVAWPELDDALMFRRLPGVFAAGEMIDWEAPTGGYLLQGCFATGTRAGQAALRWLSPDPANKLGS